MGTYDMKISIPALIALLTSATALANPDAWKCGFAADLFDVLTAKVSATANRMENKGAFTRERAEKLIADLKAEFPQMEFRDAPAGPGLENVTRTSITELEMEGGGSLKVRMRQYGTRPEGMKNVFNPSAEHADSFNLEIKFEHPSFPEGSVILKANANRLNNKYADPLLAGLDSFLANRKEMIDQLMSLTKVGKDGVEKPVNDKKTVEAIFRTIQRYHERMLDPKVARKFPNGLRPTYVREYVRTSRKIDLKLLPEPGVEAGAAPKTVEVQVTVDKDVVDYFPGGTELRAEMPDEYRIAEWKEPAQFVTLSDAELEKISPEYLKFRKIMSEVNWERAWDLGGFSKGKAMREVLRRDLVAKGVALDRESLFAAMEKSNLPPDVKHGVSLELSAQIGDTPVRKFYFGDTAVQQRKLAASVFNVATPTEEGIKRLSRDTWFLVQQRINHLENIAAAGSLPAENRAYLDLLKQFRKINRKGNSAWIEQEIKGFQDMLLADDTFTVDSLLDGMINSYARAKGRLVLERIPVKDWPFALYRSFKDATSPKSLGKRQAMFAEFYVERLKRGAMRPLVKYTIAAVTLGTGATLHCAIGINYNCDGYHARKLAQADLAKAKADWEATRSGLLSVSRDAAGLNASFEKDILARGAKQSLVWETYESRFDAVGARARAGFAPVLADLRDAAQVGDTRAKRDYAAIVRSSEDVASQFSRARLRLKDARDALERVERLAKTDPEARPLVELRRTELSSRQAEYDRYLARYLVDQMFVGLAKPDNEPREKLYELVTDFGALNREFALQVAPIEKTLKTQLVEQAVRR
jgi:hypothetical protein